MFFIAGYDIDRILVRPRLFLPDAFQTFEKVLGPTFTVGISDKGFYAQDTIEKFEGLEQLADFLRSATQRSVFDKYLDKAEASRGVYDEGVVLSDNRRYLNLASIRKIVGDSAKSVELIDELVRKSILYRGLVLKCGYCRNADWFQVGEFTHQFTCKRCSRRQVYTKEHWREPAEPAWFYKLDEIVYQGYSQQMIVPILALDYLRRVSENSFLYTTELEVKEMQTGKLVQEIDIACIPDGVLTIGEAKTEDVLAATGAEERSLLSRYRRVAESAGARRVVFATLSPVWSTSTTQRIGEVFGGSCLDVRLLNGADLS